MWIRSQTTERGATAIMVALLAVVLFGMAAITVDLGNAWARKRDVQTQVDLAALAGASSLPDEDEARDKVLAYLGNGPTTTANKVWGQDQAWDLDDFDLKNGEVSFPHDYMIRVVAPEARVDFGFAQVLGLLDPDNPNFEKVDVSAVAEVEIKSPGVALPMYVAQGCDWKIQTITDPANGHLAAPVVPTLTPTSPTISNPNDARLNPPSNSNPNPSPSGIDLNQQPTPTITLSGNQLRGVTAVGFTTAGGTHVTYTLPVANSSQSSLQIPVPSGVSSVEGTWYIRVWKNNAWSNNAEALRFSVGPPTLDCAGSSSGNFGTLRLSRTDVSSGSALAMNIAAGVQVPLSLFPEPAPSDCTSNALAVEAPNDGTNCVETDPGISASAVTDGLVTGVGSHRGLLDKPTTPGCDPTGGDNELYLQNVDGNDDYYVNNDVLSCFFINSSVRVQDVYSESYSVNGGNPVISSSIFDSPRFFWLPVVSYDPTHGASRRYSIVGFRPAFLTDELDGSSQSSRQMGSATNGLTVTNSGITSVKVVLINPDALPQTTASNGPVMDYMGSGTRVLRLVK